MYASSSIDHHATQLNESLVEEAFHALLQDALIQAQAEGLLKNEEISKVDNDVKIIAASLSLYFAALQAQGDPPGIAFPNNSNLVLSLHNCPPSFASYFQLWLQSVSKIKRLTLEMRHDLALILCEKEPISSPIKLEVVALARDLKAVAVDIIQRSSFQKRFQADIQTAIDSSLRTSLGDNGHYIAPPSGSPPSTQMNNLSSAAPALPPRIGGSRRGFFRPLPPPPLPTIAIEPPEEDTTALTLIRETLLAALADCLASDGRKFFSILGNRQEKSWSSRYYFGSLCLAILDVCLSRVHLPPSTDQNHLTFGERRGPSYPWKEAYVRTVYDKQGHDRISLNTCPSELSRLLMRLLETAMFVQSLSESDDLKAMQDAAKDQVTKEEDLYIYRLKRRLLGDVSLPLGDKPGEDHVKDAAAMINRMALCECETLSIMKRARG